MTCKSGDAPISLIDADILNRITRIGLKARRPVEGNVAGLHRSPLHGLSPEFVDFRSYTPGDDLKNLDWRAFARSDRFYIKRFEEESNLRAYFVVDDSASMAYGRTTGPHPPGSKFHCAARIAVSLATVLLRQRDAVGLNTAGNELRSELRPSGAGWQISKLIDRLEALQPARTTDLGPALSMLADQIPRRSLVILLSDLLTPVDTLFDGLGKLLHHGHEVIVCHILDRDEVELPFDDSVIFRDIEGDEELYAEPWAFRKQYRAAMEQFISDMRQRCQFGGVDYLQVFTDEDLSLILSRFLYDRQRTAGPKIRGHAPAARTRAAAETVENATTAEST